MHGKFPIFNATVYIAVKFQFMSTMAVCLSLYLYLWWIVNTYSNKK